MIKMTKSGIVVAALAIVGLLMGISLVSIGVYGQEDTYYIT
jgi:hypothetical protein